MLCFNYLFEIAGNIVLTVKPQFTGGRDKWVDVDLSEHWLGCGAALASSSKGVANKSSRANTGGATCIGGARENCGQSIGLTDVHGTMVNIHPIYNRGLTVIKCLQI